MEDGITNVNEYINASAQQSNTIQLNRYRFQKMPEFHRIGKGNKQVYQKQTTGTK